MVRVADMGRVQTQKLSMSTGENEPQRNPAGFEALLKMGIVK